MTELVPVTVENGETVMLSRDYAESVGYKVADVEVSRSGKIVDPSVVGGWNDKTVAELNAEITFRNGTRGDDAQIQPNGRAKAALVAALEADDTAQAGL